MGIRLWGQPEMPGMDQRNTRLRLQPGQFTRIAYDSYQLMPGVQQPMDNIRTYKTAGSSNKYPHCIPLRPRRCIASACAFNIPRVDASTSNTEFNP